MKTQEITVIDGTFGCYCNCYLVWTFIDRFEIFLANFSCMMVARSVTMKMGLRSNFFCHSFLADHGGIKIEHPEFHQVSGVCYNLFIRGWATD